LTHEAILAQVSASCKRTAPRHRNSGMAMRAQTASAEPCRHCRCRADCLHRKALASVQRDVNPCTSRPALQGTVHAERVGTIENDTALVVCGGAGRVTAEHEERIRQARIV
jgi:hypothetical protein